MILSTPAIESAIGCPACQSRLEHILGMKRDYSLSRCTDCGTIFFNGSADKRHTEALYDHYYDRARFEIPSVAAVSLERLVQSFERMRRTGLWLDVGYGEGGLLGIAERYGWSCFGTEISPQAIEFGQKRGWVVNANPENDPRFPRTGFDVVTMIELLEHVHSPHEVLRAAARWLRPGGLLYITTPNANSLNRRVLGLDWSIFSPPEHVTIWSVRGLRRALTKTGFKVQRVRTEGFNPCEILARLRARNEVAQPVDRNTTAFALNSAFSSSPLRRALKAGINRCLSAFQAGDTLKIWAVRN